MDWAVATPAHRNARKGSMADSRDQVAARILITCDASPLGEAALDAAVALARQFDGELAGLFVENVNLLRMAELPFAREVALSGARSRRVEVDALERTLRRQADAARDALSRAAHALDLPWSFQVVRGTLLDSVLAAMREADLAVFGYAGQYAANPAAIPAATRAPTIRPHQPIMVIYDDTAQAARALGVAGSLARMHRTGVFVLLIAPDAGAAQCLRERAGAQLESGISVQFQSIRSRDVQAIRKAADAHHAAALLWHGAESTLDRRTLATLVDALKCPVVLVS